MTGPADSLPAIHAEIDAAATALEALHRERLRCRIGCAFCCVDEITVFEVEADRIRQHHPDLLATGEPFPVGGCAFLDEEGACRVYEDRPYVCRTQGLPLRWEDETPDGEPAEFRDICPLNESGTPVEGLSPAECWEIGPFEERLAALQAVRDSRASDGRVSVSGAGTGRASDGGPRVGDARDGNARARIRLRDLFTRRAPDPDPGPTPSGA